MATKLTPINQEIILDLTAKTGNIENSIKGILQKLQSNGLSDSFTKSYVDSLKKILDKSQELRKVISTTTETNAQGISMWANAYDKLGLGLNRVISKLEDNKLDFSDLVGYDKAEYNKLISQLENVKKVRDEIYSTKNIATKAAGKLSPGSSITPAFQAKATDPKVISNQEEINKLMSDQEAKLRNAPALAQQKLDIATKELQVYERMKILSNELQNADLRTTKGKALRAELQGYGVTGQSKVELKTDTDSKLALTTVEKLSTKVAKAQTVSASAIALLNTQLQELNSYKTQILAFATELGIDFNNAAGPIKTATTALETFENEAITAGQANLDKTQQEMEDTADAAKKASTAAKGFSEGLTALEQKQAFFSNIQSRITQLFGLANVFQLVRRIVREAWRAIKELDAAFTKIAVVTDKTTSDLWDSFGVYNKMAQQLGVTTVDAIKTSALYYQQGLDTADVMTLTTETIKMAQIANMGFEEATKAMTAAIRGFKLEMSDANLVTDVYSSLAAEAAVDTQDLAVAISKVASIAGNAGLSFESTSAFLTQIIETTQEAAATAGTALKTIIARFTELTKDPTSLTVEVEGEVVDANKIEAALRLAKVDLRDTEGQFRDLDTVFLELSESWDSLDRNTQRYISTTAAGSRQQSRFIAMMDNHERTMELVAIANDSAGASEIQFAKTLDSVSSKVNKLKANFDNLIGNLIQNKTVKGVLDVLNQGMSFLVSMSEKGIVSFGAMIAVIGILVKKALMGLIGLFNDTFKKLDSFKAKASKPITIKVNLDTTEAEDKAQALRNKVNGVIILGGEVAPTTPGVDGVIPPTGAGAVPPAATQKLGAGVKNAVKSGAASGIAMGLVAGIASRDVATGLTAGFSMILLSVLTSPAVSVAITSALGSIGAVIAASAGPLLAVAAIAAIGFALYKWLDPLEQAKKKAKELKAELEKLQASEEKTRATYLTEQDKLKTLQQQKDRYFELKDAIGLTAEEQNELNGLTAGLASDFPQLVAYYNEAGNAVLKQSEYWDNILDTQKDIVDETRKIYAKNVVATSLVGLSATIAEYNEAVEALKSNEFFTKIKNEADEARKEADSSGNPFAIREAAEYANAVAVATLTAESEEQIVEYQKIVDSFVANTELAKLKIQNAFKQLASIDLSYMQQLYDFKMDESVLNLGQLDIQSQLNDVFAVIQDFQQSGDADITLAANFNELSDEAQAYLIQIKDTIAGADLDTLMAGVSESLANGLAEEYKKLGNNQNLLNNINNAIELIAHKTRVGFQEAIEDIFGPDNPLIPGLIQAYDEAGKETDRVMKALASSEVIAAAPEDRELYSVWTEGGDEAVIAYLEGLAEDRDLYNAWTEGGDEAAIAYLEGLEAGFTSEEIQVMIDDMKARLEGSNLYQTGLKLGTDVILGLYTAFKAEDVPKLVDYLSTTGLDTKGQEILATGDITSVEGAKNMALALTNLGIGYDKAVVAVTSWATETGYADIITSEAIYSTELLAQKLNQLLDPTDAADIALNELNNTQNLSDAALEELIKQYPDLTDELLKFSKLTVKEAKDYKALKDAIKDVKAYNDLKTKLSDINTELDKLADKEIDPFGKQQAAQNIARELGGLDAGVDEQFVIDNQGLITKAVNGSKEAFIQLQTKAKESLLAMSVGAKDAAFLIDSYLSGVTTFLTDKFEGKDYNFTISANTDFAALYTSLSAAGLSATQVLETISKISGVKIEVVPINAADMPAFSYMLQNGLLEPEDLYQFRVVGLDTTYSPPNNFPTGGGKGGGGKKSEYETKVDPYYNEIQAIKKLNTELKKLAELRGKGNLSPEEYRKNLNQTANYYKNLQSQLHDYNEKLRADRAELETEVANLKLPNAISMKDGKLSTNKAAIDAITSATTREKIDNIITKVDKLNDVLKENSDAWWEVKYALEELADKYLESFINTEDKIRDILIKQDQDEIDATEKKYDKLKEADEDYLKALRDNIDKRRRARDKETDYSDLAKKEKRLALLKRDTSGIYGAEILSLEEEIAQTRRELSDKEVDDMIDSLEEQATTRADAYDKELKELQDLQSDKEKSMVEYNKEVDKIMQSGAENVLAWLQTYDKEYLTASETARQKYLEGWKNTINEANGYVNNVLNGAVTTSQDAAATKAQGIYSNLRGMTNTATSKKSDSTYATAVAQLQSSNATQALAWFANNMTGREGIDEATKKLFWQIVLLKHQYENLGVPKFPGYSEGGIVNTTGLAMVHGTTTKPEAFLSASDTRNFQTLAQLLSSVITYNGTSGETPEGGGTTVMGDINITIEVAELSDDYDVEQMVEKVKQEIVNSSSYRNVNLINKVR